MAHRQAFPADVGTDQRGIHVHDLAGRDLRGDAGLDRPLKDAPEPFRSPALADSRQARMIGKIIVQAIANEPADRQVHLRLAHQLAIMDDAQQDPRQHPPHRDFRIDPRPAVVGTIKLSHLTAQPGQIEDPIDPGEDVIVRHQLAQ
jgi:hypothetical protein